LWCVAIRRLQFGVSSAKFFGIKYRYRATAKQLRTARPALSGQTIESRDQIIV